ncbi:MAG: helix-turn-helix transcriptional regulator [Actinomycetota bacterium]|nr:helix-turn-helix transcriptional regulator [Actinomycetota bacterium]
MPLNANKLARVLAEQGRKKSWLAEALEVDRSTITRWVKGETTPRPFRRNEIARLLGLSVSELF